MNTECNKFNLEQIRLTKDSRLYNKMMKNIEYLLFLDCDRLLYHFRVYAGLDIKNAKSYGGWEGEWSAIKGEFLGHYMCACINSYYNTINIDDKLSTEFKHRVDYITSELHKCQEAIAKLTGEDYPNAFGYVAAIPSKQLDMVESLTTINGYDGGVPYYVHHKTLKGLVETFNAFHNHEALNVAINFADYLYTRLKDYDDTHMEKMLNSHRYPVQYFKEFGGMHEVLIDLYKISNNKNHLELAMKFDRDSFRNSLIHDNDCMAHHMQHANSEIPCINGLSAYYELTSDEDYKKATCTFLDWMKNGHTFPTGGTSGPSVYPDYGGEFFNYPNLFFDHVTYSNPDVHKDSGESCCSHNLNKICDQAFTWDADITYAEEYEKRFVNAVLSQQNEDTGMFLYNLNLSQGTKKGFGTPEDSFWCCYCSGIEAYSSLQNAAFYHNENKIWINNYLDCTLNYDKIGLKVREETLFPDDGNIRLVINLEKPTELEFNIRIPIWAKSNKILVNNEILYSDSTPSTYVSISRDFDDGDIIGIEFDFDLYIEEMPDRPEYVAVKYGPNLLVACGDGFSTYDGDANSLLNSLEHTGNTCEFKTTLSTGDVIFKPLHRIKDEHYNGYTIITQPTERTVLDILDLSDRKSYEDHDFKGSSIRNGSYKGKHRVGTDYNGWFEVTLDSNPDKNVYLNCLYWGSEYGNFHNFTPSIRLFDIQIQDENDNYINIATQLLDCIFPNNWHDKIYPIPYKYTQGKDKITIRFKAKKFGIVDGVVGNLYDNISLFTY